MSIRSWLFVPGDSEDKLGKVAASGADAVIVDLEDAVAEANKPTARGLAREWLVSQGAAEFEPWVRINALDTPLWRDDLAAVLPGKPRGIMVPKASGPEQLQLLAAELYELEGRAGVPTGSTRIVPLVSETTQASLGIAAYANAQNLRLAGLTWGAEDLSAAIGAQRKRDAQGQWTDVFRYIRAQVLLAAHTRGIMAIDTLHADFRDLEALRRIAPESAADGFTGMLAIHPAQVPVINAAFSPSPAAIQRARAIVALFDGAPDAGALSLDGAMVDRPHLEQARRLLARLG